MYIHFQVQYLSTRTMYRRVTRSSVASEAHVFLFLGVDGNFIVGASSSTSNGCSSFCSHISFNTCWMAAWSGFPGIADYAATFTAALASPGEKEASNTSSSINVPCLSCQLHPGRSVNESSVPSTEEKF